MIPVAVEAGTRLQEILVDVEFLLRDQGIWADARPSDWAFASEFPFCCDRMSFPEWLQFVFIPNLQAIAQSQSVWPADCAVTPMADYYFSSQGIAADRLVAALKSVDDLVTTQDRSADILQVIRKE